MAAQRKQKTESAVTAAKPATEAKPRGRRAKGTPKTGGRQAGTPNKLSATAKENIEQVFTELGGAQRMLEFFRGDDIQALTDKAEVTEDLTPREKVKLFAVAVEERALRLHAFYEKIYPKLLPVQISGSGSKGEIVFSIQPGDEGI